MDFERIRSSISFERYLEHFDTGLTPDPHRSGIYRGNCPFALHPGNRDSYSFRLDARKQVFHCFTGCDTKGMRSVIDFHCLFRGLDPCDPNQLMVAARELWAVFIKGKRISSAPIQNIETDLTSSGFVPRSFSLRHCVPHRLKEKKVDQNTIQDFGAGVALRSKWFPHHFCVPLHDRTGKLLGYCGKDLSVPKGKWKSTSGLPKSCHLFNLHRALPYIRERVILVEGFFQAMFLWQSGYNNVIAIMGLHISAEQIKLLKEFNVPVLLAFDNDSPGRGASVVCNQMLKEENVSVKMVDFITQPNTLIKVHQFDLSSLSRLLSSHRLM